MGLAAALYAAAFSGLLSIMWVFVRNISLTLHPLEITFWGSVFGLITFLPTILKNGIGVLRTNRVKRWFSFHCLRVNP